MKKTTFALGTLIIGMAFGLVLAGCATDSGGGPSAEELAVQLTENINEIRAGSAEMDGATVTLTGGVRLENAALTVPSGVTLDLTKETLQLANNAIFTVNGTVNAKAEGVNIDSAEANPATVNGSGTISLKNKGRMLNIGGGRKLILDGVTLVGLQDNDNSLIRIGENGMLFLKSGAITGNTQVDEDIGHGGGVTMWEGGTFTMTGGTITGNTAKGVNSAFGGGVFVGGEGSTFTMTGGAITGNTAKGGIRNANGGGVFFEGSTFTMTGGTISDNSADGGGGGGGGGGVSVASATFNMSGGTISGNSTTASNGEGGGGGVRVFNPGATFTMEGGAIFGNASENGGGVHVRNRATFTMKGGRIQGGTDSDGFTKNTDTNSDGSSALYVHNGAATAKWGSDGTYTKGGVSQTGDGDIVELNKHLSEADWDWAGSTDDTLIAVPAQ